MGVPEQIGEEVNFKLEIVPSDLVCQRLVFAMEKASSVPGPEGNRPSVGLVQVIFLSEQLAV